MADSVVVNGRTITGAELEAWRAKELGPLPWQCWDIPGFKACHDEAGNRTYRQLVNEKGLDPNSDLYKEFYPQFLRSEIYDCQVAHACNPAALEVMQDAAQAHAPLEENSARMMRYALVGVGLVAAYYFYKRTARS